MDLIELYFLLKRLMLKPSKERRAIFEMAHMIHMASRYGERTI